MAVGSGELGTLHPVKGISMAAVSAGIKKPGRLDCVVFSLGDEATVAGVFTTNAFCAAPVTVCKNHLAQAAPRYFVINTGNANAGTGKQGIDNALQVCLEVAELKQLPVAAILPFSTGVIGEQLPVTKIIDAIPHALDNLVEDNWLECARGIMTTDTRPKAASVRVDIGGKPVTITGIAKGAGMIKPNMATMLGYVFTDAAIDKADLQQYLDKSVNASFNRITVDSDTSTNDCCMLAASGASGIVVGADDGRFQAALDKVFIALAQGIVRDAEGATKFITVRVEGGAVPEECLSLAYTVAESPLVKTALFASDPNWGRILAAVGRAGIQNLDIGKVAIYLGDVCIVEAGAVAPGYTEAAGQAVMEKEEITIRIVLGRGDCNDTVWTCDLSHDYVTINAEYRT
jgi:glutamate N-acetyltransferase/amino-acid N-acetyltransferase